ncbi:AzlC family ABC transporter permease [Endozoicomonadaceae bacterium StTr2]
MTTIKNGQGTRDGRLHSYLQGALATTPLIIGAIPFGIIFGAIAFDLELSIYTTLAMSVFVFAGSAQFVALGLIATASPALLITGTVIVVNLRHLFYSATLAPHLEKLPLHWKAVLSFSLTDEVFAVMSRHYDNQSTVNSHWYFLGSGSAMWIFWNISTITGYLSGASFPVMYDMGLEVAMPITFACMVVLMLNNTATVAAVFVSAITAWLGKDLPYQTGLLIATIAGITTGYLISKMPQTQEKHTC